MKKFTPSLLCVAALLSAPLAQATETSIEDSISAFSRCDAGFFKSLQTNAATWERHVSLSSSASATWIPVPDRYEDSKNSVLLKDPPTVGGVVLSSYFDEITDMEKMGRYLYWGFIAEGTPDQVARQFAPLLDHPEALRKMGSLHARAEVWEDGKWSASLTPSGTIPGTRKLERVFLLEPHGSNQTRISCSLQGAVDAKVLASIRPDIPVADHPVSAQELGFDEVAVPPHIVDALDTPLLAPHFDRLTYTYTSVAEQKPSTVTVELVAQHGLIHRTEIYSRNFTVQRLMKANLIQLKSKMEGSFAGRVLLTDSLAPVVPTGWNEGQILRFNTTTRYAPLKPREKTNETAASCTIGARYPATEVFPSLPGDAIRLSCNHGGRQSIEAYIEDLGLAIPLESTSERGRSVNRITALKVVR